MTPQDGEAIGLSTLGEMVNRRELDERDVEGLAARIFDGQSTLVLGNGRVAVMPLFERLPLARREAVVAILLGATVAPAVNI